MTIGQRMRQARMNRGLSLAWVAKRAGVDKRHLSEIERDMCSRIAGPGLLIVYAVAEAMGAPIHEVVPPIRYGCLGWFVVNRRGRK